MHFKLFPVNGIEKYIADNFFHYKQTALNLFPLQISAENSTAPPTIPL